MKRIALLMLALSLFLQAEANNYSIVKEGPVHEAYVVQEFGTILSQAVAHPPPPKITELTPQGSDPSSIWIPGYWTWSPSYGKHLWVSGIWRRPPPGLTWIPGYWKNYPQGWVWIRGFWSQTKVEDLVYIPNPPPDALDEPVSLPPTTSSGYFWVPGFWKFERADNKYVWYSGRWDFLEAHWVYFPAQYIWREEGFVFIPAFWDWPLDDRGIAFSSIFIDPENIPLIVYEPVDALEELYVMELLFPQWPNYSCLYSYHYYFHYDAWAAWGAVPIWWNWATWWCFTPTDQWWLWWWWSHPGYPNPFWINAEMANKILPPPQFVVEMMAKEHPPANVTNRGVVGDKQLFDAIQEFTGKGLPILPTDAQQIKQIQKIPTLLPSGKVNLQPKGERKIGEPPSKPFFGPSKQNLKTEPQRVIVPKVPSEESSPKRKQSSQTTQLMQLTNTNLPYTQKLPEELPAERRQIPQYGNTQEYVDPPQFQERKEDAPLEFPKPSPNEPPKQATPLPNKEIELEVEPETPLQERAPEHVNPPRYEQRPGETPSRSPIPRQPTLEHGAPPPPESPVPEQGYSPEYKFPQRSMQTQHHNRFMTNPQ